MRITIVIGTARRGRQSERVAQLLESAFTGNGTGTVELVDVRDHVTLPETIPDWGEPVWETGARLGAGFGEPSEDKDPTSGQPRYEETETDPQTSDPDTQMYAAWKDVVNRTDAFVFILPEYNHSYPGEWKLLLDSLTSAYEGKLAYIVGVSGGTFSGVRVADHVKPILVTLGFIVQSAGLYIGNVEDAVNEAGEAADAALSKRVKKFVDAVISKA